MQVPLLPVRRPQAGIINLQRYCILQPEYLSDNKESGNYWGLFDLGEVIGELVAFDTEDKIDQIESYGENNIARHDDLYIL